MSAAERLVIEPLGKQHGRSAFCCGIAELDRSCHGAGLGQLLVADAIKRILSAGDSVAMHAVIVDAKNEAAKAFYERLGFTPFPSRPTRLFLPLGSARLTSRAR